MTTNVQKYLKEIVNGEIDEIDRWSTFPDDLIYDIRLNRANPLASQVILVFENDEMFLNVFDLDDNDIWEYNNIMYHHQDWDWDQYSDYWDEGYISNNFNAENTEKLERIMRLTFPSDITEERDRLKAIYNTYERQINNIIEEYANEDTRCKIDVAKKIIMDETDKPFDKFGIIQVSHAHKFKTTVGILLNWYRMLKMEEDSNIVDLLRKIYETYINSYIGDWENLRYETYCDDFDTDNLQIEISNELDKILEIIEEQGINEEFQKIYNVVIKLGGFNKLLKLKEKEIEVIFQKIDPRTGQLNFKVYKKGGKVEERSVDNLEDLYLNLYHPELFEGFIDILNRIL